MEVIEIDHLLINLHTQILHLYWLNLIMFSLGLINNEDSITWVHNLLINLHTQILIHHIDLSWKNPLMEYQSLGVPYLPFGLFIIWMVDILASLLVI